MIFGSVKRWRAGDNVAVFRKILHIVPASKTTEVNIPPEVFTILFGILKSVQVFEVITFNFIIVKHPNPSLLSGVYIMASMRVKL